MATPLGDILLNNQPYLLVPNGWYRFESPRSQPSAQGPLMPEFEMADNWLRYGQSEWYGQGEADWLGEGPYAEGWGVDLDDPGKIKVARNFILISDTGAHPLGWIAFTVGTSWQVYLSRSTGQSMRSSTGTSFTNTANALGASVLPTGHAVFYKERWYVGAGNGHLFSTNDGASYTDHGLVGAATAVYCLGVVAGKLWMGQANDLRTWDGAAFAQQFATQMSGTPTLGTVGNSLLHIMTAGPQSGLYLTDGASLYDLAQLNNDFIPRRLVFTDTMMAFGRMTDEASTKGDVWRLVAGGFVPVWELGDVATDYGILDAMLDADKVYFGANQFTGVGVYDPAWDQFDDSQMGFYVSSVLRSIQGKVDGISQFGGRISIAVLDGAAPGIYRQDTFSTFKIVGSRFDGGRRNIRKLWDDAEIATSLLISGQSVDFKTIRAGVAEDSWGSSSALADRHVIPASTDYYARWVQYVLSGDAAGNPMEILDIAVSYLAMPENPKREWDLAIDVAGSLQNPQRMRDGTANARTSATQMANLNALWNTRTTFEDVDGTPYNVVVKSPRARDQDMHRRLTAGAVTDFRSVYRVHLSEV